MEGTKLANPGPLGLAGFGMTTILLSIHNTGCLPMASAIMAMAVFYGGIAQIMAGIMEFKKGNTFGMTAFISYGSFWLTLVFILIFKGLPESPPAFMGWYLFVWGLSLSSCGSLPTVVTGCSSSSSSASSWFIGCSPSASGPAVLLRAMSPGG